MATIIAGRFDTQAEGDRALNALRSDGFDPQDLTCFYLNPAGQHAEYPIGGDAHHDEGTKHAGKSAATTAAIGGVTGLALGTAVGAAIGEAGLAAAGAIAGAGIGGYVGSLAGGLSGTRSGDPAQASVEEPVERAAGVVVAVRVDPEMGSEDRAIQALRTNRALEIERATGQWNPAERPAWTDFDPRRTPDIIGAAPGQSPLGPAGPQP